jgi:hypothetical protein
MSRTDKIKKLANAIREYRGLRDIQSKKWIRSPKPSAGIRVVKWLTELGLNAQVEFVRVNTFTKVSEFHEWLKQLETPPQLITP